MQMSDLASLVVERQDSTPCEVCKGKRFTAEVLRHPLRGKNISKVLGMSVRGAHDVFGEHTVRPMLKAWMDVGLEDVTPDSLSTRARACTSANGCEKGHAVGPPRRTERRARPSALRGPESAGAFPPAW
jgi:hypothetical protein